ncbi:CRISPR-associated endonuclease Cas2 [Bacteroides oleiciplenus]|uniref:CRISPR-associated endoribonuclease Cas2 n=1 Tax=Bacteroides oleiciplenus TaxID=626931 RepID=A0A3E5B9J5_9BACE|nr:CRISPR-associated endonuclease Cas2 [Bacteroides oleiciplenus]RGN34267.1 CRISPR-associated endonuclease Cas2 [Bacteroides oleiciplenus]
MFILVTYDVDTQSETGAKRLRKVAKECLNYGHRVQNSVFECVLSEAQFLIFKSKIMKIIDYDLDSIRFYFLGKNRSNRIECLGRETSIDVNSELII